jgi:hypothetical protein
MDKTFETIQAHIVISNKLDKIVKSSWEFQPVLKHINTKK